MSTITHRAELISEWGNSPPVEKIFEPAQCWAARRGRTHNGNRSSSAIACSHLKPSECPAALCIPLTTQGEIFGILVLLRNQAKLRLVGDVPPNALAKTRRIGAAFQETPTTAPSKFAKALSVWRSSTSRPWTPSPSRSG